MPTNNPSYNYEQAIQEWGERIRNHSGLKVCIARKSPRLIEVLHKKYDLEFGYENLISEHAVPFVLPEYCEQQKQHTGKVPNILISDDSVYHGTTIENIKKITTYGRAFFSQEDFDLTSIEMNTSVIAEAAFTRIPGIPVVDQLEVPRHVDRMASDFIDVRKPFDVEFPILTFTLASDKKEEEFLEQIYNCLQEVFGKSKVYKTVHPKDHDREEVSNFSVLIAVNPDEQDVTQPEFFKIRIFLEKNENGFLLRIVPFAPHIIHQGFLHEDSSIFLGSFLECVWKEVASKAQRIPELTVIENLMYYENQLLRNEYNYYVKRSLNIWANYLLSFAQLIRIKDQINRLLESMGATHAEMRASIDEKDLYVLIGKSLSDQIKPELEDFYNDKGLITDVFPENRDFYRNTDIPDQVIPDEYKQSFTESRLRDWQKSMNNTDRVAGLFSVMHHKIDVASRERTTSSFPLKRLKFGVSFASLQRELNYFSREEVDVLEIHKAIDQKIDAGSVVPQYVGFSYDDAMIWRRLLRSGENEDEYREQLFRTSVFLLNIIDMHTFSIYLPVIVVENVLLYILGKVELANTGGVDYQPVFDNIKGYPCIYIKNLGGEPISLTEYLIRHEILQLDTNRKLYRLNRTPQYREWEKTTSLDSEIQKRMEEAINCLLTQHKNVQGDY
jgi:hypothetical protein